MSTCTDDQKLAQADTWLSTNIDPLIKSAAFQNSLLIIVFDEGDNTDIQNFGGHVAAVVVSPQIVSPGYQSTTQFEHASTLRLMMEGLGVSDLPGAAASAADLKVFIRGKSGLHRNSHRCLSARNWPVKSIPFDRFPARGTDQSF